MKIIKETTHLKIYNQGQTMLWESSLYRYDFAAKEYNKVKFRGVENSSNYKINFTKF